LLGPTEKAFVHVLGSLPVQISADEAYPRQSHELLLRTTVRMSTYGQRGARYCFPQLFYWRNVFGGGVGELTVAFRAHSITTSFV